MLLATETPTQAQTFSRVRLAECNKILVVKLDRLGDFLLATPFLRGLRKSAPHAHISLVVLPESTGIAELCPYVDRVIQTSAIGENARINCKDLSEVQAFYQDIQAGNFDLALIPRWDYDFMYATAFAVAAKARNIIAFSKPDIYDLEDYGRRCTETLVRPFVAHEVEHNLALLEFVGGTPDGDEIEIWIGREDQEFAADVRRQTVGDEPFVVIFPGAAQRRRRLPGEKLGAILRGVRARFPGLRFVMLGSEVDEPIAQKAAAALTGCVSFCGKTTVRQAAAIAASSFGAITMDSAPAHMAAAMNLPLVVFCCHGLDGDPGDVHSPARFGPRGSSNYMVLQPPTTLWPCKDRCRADAPHCIVNITEESAVQAIVKVLQRSGRIPSAQ